MLETGTLAPELEFEDSAGQPWRLSDHRGAHGTLLYFMRSTSCPVCNRHVRQLLVDRDDFDSANVRVLIAVPESRDIAAAWKTKRGISFPVLVGTDGIPHDSIGLARKVFGAMQQSGTLLVDMNGVVRHAHSATLPTAGYDRKGISAAVRSLSTATTN
ncbi:peroxiredoxin family protein [Nocardia blacklockiae]|uniref:peroxiredoxin family protein n=1 Tax=Nocardia blacklockiae TaxID=480036 RepID=UPI0018961FBB|nr:redoxin domain-containing protein [Nocardia blacklockiae]MBF6172108.1 redoxin domain-containing protein [Nocardia blacklockiae]